MEMYLQKGYSEAWINQRLKSIDGDNDNDQEKSINQISIVDLRGKTVLTKKVQNTNKTQLDFSNLSNGVYYILLKGDNNFVQIFKVVKIK